MNELEQAFEELAHEEGEKLSQRLAEQAAEDEQPGTGLGEEVIEDVPDVPEEPAEDISPAEAVQEDSGQSLRIDRDFKELGVTDLDSMIRVVKENSSRWEQQLKELSELSGTAVYGMNGMTQLPNYDRMERLIRAGVAPADAYKAANYDSLVRTQVQKEKNKIIGKAHLKASGGGAGANEVTVPKDVYLAFKMLEPKITDAEIRKFYKKTQQD